MEKFMYRKLFFTIATIFLVSVPLLAQTQQNEVKDRVKQLESQVQTILAELEKLKKSAERTARTDKTETVVTPEKKVEQDKKSIGIELGNGVRAVPYGTVYFNLFGNDAGTNNSDIPLFATATGKGNIGATVRQTRLGIRVEGAKVGNARLTGVIETDFFGGSPAIGIGENFGVVRVRLANAKLDWENTSLTVGQDWIPFAPNSPVSIADAAIPQFAAAGNNWARLPQVKVEQRFNDGKIVWQGAILAPQTGDSNATANFLQQPNSGALSRFPFLQTRFSFNQKDWFGTKKTGSIGVSAHYGRSRVNSTTAPIIEQDIDSYGAALDWNFPLHQRIVWSGEGVFGQNLAGFQAGVFQNYNTDFAVLQNNILVPSGVKAIETRGGWTQLGFTPNIANDKLTLYGSIGLDDPKNLDLINTKNRDFRSRNFAWAFDAIYKFTPQFQFGLEFRQLNTYYLNSGKKRANHVNLGAAYSF
jgi:hypothetical protein